jgi:hypothetical protein
MIGNWMSPLMAPQRLYITRPETDLAGCILDACEAA